MKAFLLLLSLTCVEAFTTRPNNAHITRASKSLALQVDGWDRDSGETKWVSQRRREVLATVLTTANLRASQRPALAADDEYTGNGFAFKFVPPGGMEPGEKPVKTHLYEKNWKSSNLPKYTFGVTVDPVRIQSLQEVSFPILVLSQYNLQIYPTKIL